MDKKRFTMNFLTLMGCMFVLYFFAVGFSEPAAGMLRYMNDRSKSQTLGEVIGFLLLAIPATAAWCGFWVYAKRAEKICVDELSKKQRGRKK